MSQTVVERATDNVVESAQQASRATDVIDNGVGAVRHTVKQGCDVAEEFLDETACRLRRHLALTVVATLATGVVAGALIGRVLRQRSACN